MSENNHDISEILETVMKKPSGDQPVPSLEAWLRRYRRNATIGACYQDCPPSNDRYLADMRNQASMRIFEKALDRLKERGYGNAIRANYEHWLSTPGKSDLLHYGWLRGVRECLDNADELGRALPYTSTPPRLIPAEMKERMKKPQDEQKVETNLQACNRDYDPGVPLSTPGMQLARNPLGKLRKYAMLDVNHKGGRDARSWFAENGLEDTLSMTSSVVTPETWSEHKKACSEALSGITDSVYRFLRRVRKVVFLSQLAKDAPKDATELYGVPLHYFRRYELMFTYVTNDANDPLKTVVDWEGLRALAAKDAAEEVTANKSANLMKGMDGSSNYGHRFTR